MESMVGVRALRQNLSRYLERVKRGEAFVVTERGTTTLAYPDRSAYVRLIVEEPESAALQDALAIVRRLDPRELRSLDAIHLATALSIGPDLDALFCYESRLTVAARAAGLQVPAPV